MNIKKTKTLFNPKCSFIGTTASPAMAASQRVLTAGDFTTFWQPGREEKVVLVTAVREGRATEARRYAVQDSDTGECFESYGCWQKPVTVADVQLDDSLFDVVNGELSVGPSRTVPGPQVAESVKKTKRFPVLLKDEVDQLAGARTSKNTDEQTKWGVRIFRGESPSVNMRWKCHNCQYTV